MGDLVQFIQLLSNGTVPIQWERGACRLGLDAHEQF